MAGYCFGALLVAVLIGAWLSSCMAYDFYVGGRHGWFPNPHEPFNDWAGRNRFQVHDNLVFNYNKESDSILLVSKEQYDTCNTTNSYLMLQGGQSTYTFSRSGPFYFISGNSTRCTKHGERLIVIVMAIREKGKIIPPSSHPIFPPPPSVVSPAAAPVIVSKPPSISPAESEKSSNLPPQPHSSSNSINVNFGTGLIVVGMLALGIGSVF